MEESLESVLLDKEIEENAEDSFLHHVSGMIKDRSKLVIDKFGASAFYLVNLSSMPGGYSALGSMALLTKQSMMKLKSIIGANIFLFDFKEDAMVTIARGYGKYMDYDMLIRRDNFSRVGVDLYNLAKSKLKSKKKEIVDGHTLGYFDHCSSKIYFLASNVKLYSKLVTYDEDGQKMYLTTKERLMSAQIVDKKVDLFKVLTHLDSESVKFFTSLFPTGPLMIVDIKNKKIYSFEKVDGDYVYKVSDKEELPEVYGTADHLFNKKEDYSSLYG